jgi:ABC-2 type transport system ATP-binding protein
LSEQGIEIVSMRNKANRLEELFIDMVEKNLDKNEGNQDE